MTDAFNNILTKRKKLKEELIAKYGENFDQPARIIRVLDAEEQVIRQWLEELKPEIMAIQGPGPLGDDEPYYGAIGGGVTYSFTPTGLGYILVVKEATTGKELNVTQALDWYFFD